MSHWQELNLAAINKRLAPVRRMPPGILFAHRSQYNHIIVRRTTDQVVLCYRHEHRRLEEVESRLSLADPLALVSDYTQAMLLTLAWQPAPSHILLVGLGGGRLQMVLHHYLEDTSIFTVEIDPVTVEVARRFFGFAPDARQHITVKDGRNYLRGMPAEAPYDVILLDAYHAGGIPLHLCTCEFYAECRVVLTPTGVVATNLQAATPLYDAARKTFAASFRHTAALPLLGGNVVVIGSDADRLHRDEIQKRVTAVQQRYGCDFALPEWSQALAIKAPYRPNAPILRDADG
ncbi:MAG TPA: fused MFS/spermidine synthase [Candidatus Binatia bacterium]|jgi:spermidine synthase|nr:fused MFS/spermidine synthase [Candidatus Binatia bacterium]